MNEDERKSDRQARIILIGLMILALVTIAGTIISTMGEWAQPEPQAESTPPQEAETP